MNKSIRVQEFTNLGLTDCQFAGLHHRNKRGPQKGEIFP